MGPLAEPVLIQITQKRMIAGKDFLESRMDDPSLKHRIEEPIGRQVVDDQLRTVAFKVSHRWAIEQTPIRRLDGTAPLTARIHDRLRGNGG